MSTSGGRGRLTKFGAWVAFVLFTIALVWGQWARFLDFLDHITKTFLGDDRSDALQNIVREWLRSHATLANEIGPWLFFGAGVIALLAPVAVPIAFSLWDRARIAREADAASGWSVSIDTARAVAAILVPDAPNESMISFQQFRFVNISNVRPRTLDLKITIEFGDRAHPTYTWDSIHEEKIKYQRDVEKLEGHIHHRGFQFINFPLKLAPSEMVDGQIVIRPPSELLAAKSYGDVRWMHSSRITFKFIEHVSRREIEFTLGEKFDAHRGRIEPEAPKRPNIFARRLAALRNGVLSRLTLPKS